jgi:hypothetical protein
MSSNRGVDPIQEYQHGLSLVMRVAPFALIVKRPVGYLSNEAHVKFFFNSDFYDFVEGNLAHTKNNLTASCLTDFIRVAET